MLVDIETTTGTSLAKIIQENKILTMERKFLEVKITLKENKFTSESQEEGKVFNDFKLKFLASESTLSFQCSCSRVGSVLQSSVGKLVVEPTQRHEGVMAVDVRYYYFVVYRKITTFLGFVPHPLTLSTHL